MQPIPDPPIPKVLIADDNPQGVELLEAYLSNCDYEIRTAYDGEETLKAVRDWQPDLILLDIMMPKISGFEVCKRLRADPVTRHIAVLMITALDQHSDSDRAVAPGFIAGRRIRRSMPRSSAISWRRPCTCAGTFCAGTSPARPAGWFSAKATAFPG